MTDLELLGDVGDALEGGTLEGEHGVVALDLISADNGR